MADSMAMAAPAAGRRLGVYRPPQRQRDGSRQAAVFGVVVLAHIGAFAALWYLKPDVLPKPPEIFYLTLDRLTKPPPPPPPPIKLELKPVELPPLAAMSPPPLNVIEDKPQKLPTSPAPVAKAPPKDDGPPVQYFAPGASAGTGHVTSALGTVGDGVARRAPSDYDGKIKSRIQAAKVFPMPAQLQRQECVIPYSVTIDKSGKMIAHHIDPCLYPLINQAAEEAIVKAAAAGAFEAPENGQETKVVYGSLPFHLEIKFPPPSPNH